jgi:hypothetical protein
MALKQEHQMEMRHSVYKNFMKSNILNGELKLKIYKSISQKN